MASPTNIVAAGKGHEPRLTPRQCEVLRALIREYIASATPVGSATIQRIANLGVSSATIRNELAILEELGYLDQPHTSAGRVPTIKGYRYFVEQLMDQPELPAPQRRMIRHQFHQIRLNLDQWMELTAAVLAHTTRAASLVTPPQATNSRYKHLELISIQDTLVLMILVLQDSSIHQEMLTTTQPVSQDSLSQFSNQLNALLHDQTAQEIEENIHPALASLQGWKGDVFKRLLYRMHQVDQCQIREIHRDGLINVAQQPEFEDVAKFRQLLELLEHSRFLETVLARTMHANGVQIIIGGEGPYRNIYDLSLVLSPYGIRGKATGVLGIMGPIRMHYGQAISTVRYVADLMNGLVNEVYGES